MRTGGSKAKGNSFEWKIAKALGETLYKDKDTFIRTPSSGALNTIRKMRGTMMEQNVKMSGDIMQIAHFATWVFPYSVECKHHKDFNILDLLWKKEKSVAYKAWEQCCRDADSSKQKPALVYRSNNQPIYVVHYGDWSTSNMNNLITNMNVSVLLFSDWLEYEGQYLC